MVSINDINQSIIQGKFNNEQLNSIAMAVKFARGQLSKQTKASLTMGDNVNFHHSSHGCDYTGTVVKIARKFVTVRTANGLWRVPANMLEVV